MFKNNNIILTMIMCMLITCLSLISISAVALKTLVFLGETINENEINRVKNEYEELNDLFIKKGKLEDKTNLCYSYVVYIDELKNNEHMINYINNVLENNLVYFVGNSTIKEVEEILNIEIKITAPIYDFETNMPIEKKATYINENTFSIFAYSKNTNITGFGNMVTLNTSLKDDYILAILREFKENALTIQPYYTILKSGNGRKLYTDVQKDIYTTSSWIAYSIPNSDPNKNYFATKVNIHFNKDGRQACIKQKGLSDYGAMSIGVAPTNTGPKTSWTFSIPAGISVSYSGAKMEVKLTRPDDQTNFWSFCDGTFMQNARFDSGDDFECITQWSTTSDHPVFLYYENGYDIYGGYSASTMTGISL